MRIRESTFGKIRVGSLERFANCFEADSVAVELVRVHFDAHGGTRTAPGKNLADAFYLRELLREDGIRSIVDLRGRNVFGTQRQQHDRGIGRIDLSVAGLTGKIGRKLAAGGINGGLNVARGSIDVAVEVKLESNAGGAEPARGSHLRDASDAAELALEGRSDSGGHGFRAGARQASADTDRGKINLRQRGDRQETKRNRAREKDGEGEQRGGYGPANERRGEIGRKVHGSVSGRRLFDRISDVPGEAVRQPIKSQINHRRGVQGQQLAEDEAADDGDAEGTAQFRTDAGAQRERQTA